LIAALTARDVLAATDGRLLQGDGGTRFHGVSIDTRTLEPGFLFFAIRGPHHDAHRFLADAARSGATGWVIDDAEACPSASPTRPPVAILVPDTTRALGQTAAWHRQGFTGPLVAITGSNGKTTTKEMCAAILSEAGPCLRTRGNLNNEYGLPLTLLARSDEDRTAVVELGMNHRGEIARLAAIARATVGVVTNVGSAHLEHLGSREEIAREKADLLAALPADATAVLFGDDPLLCAQRERIVARVRTFGLGPDCDVRAERIERPRAGRFAFDLVCATGRVRVEVAGIHAGTVPNALAAATAARVAGAPDADVVAGLAAYEPAPGRMNLRALAGDLLVLDDTYNANPQSLAAALSGLMELRGEGRALAVLGDMGELGRAAPDAHREAGRLAARLAVDWLAALGDHAALVIASAGEAGLPTDRGFVASDHEELVERLLRELRPGDRILVKGSRSMRMERIVEKLVKRWGAA
jgi:UDP-N-acetylmuramoyl-tripeptide--D-alanyl-D-alanine ligase